MRVLGKQEKAGENTGCLDSAELEDATLDAPNLKRRGGPALKGGLRDVVRRLGFGIWRLISRLGLPVAVLCVCVWLLWPQLSQHSLAQLQSDLRGISWPAWLAAASLSVISLWAVGRYDGIAHRHFGTRVPDHQARWTGSIAIGLSQCLGFGIITGSLARWRMITSLSLTKSLQIASFVALTFVIGWAGVTALVCLLLPAPAWSTLPAAGVLILCALACVAMLRWPQIGWRGRNVRFPSLLGWGAILGWSAVDVIAAAGVLFVLLPQGVDLSFPMLLPVFLLALGAGLFSNTPGGAGPFEVLLIALLPQVNASDALSAILAYRAVYYGVPFCLAALALLAPFGPLQLARKADTIDLARAPNAEVGIIAQNGGHVLQTADGACAVWPTAQTVTALCDPVRGSADALLPALSREATALGRLALIYKCNAQTALSARKSGWQVLHVSDDAILAPRTYSLDPSSRRNLRRKLRNADKAGVTIEWGNPPDWADLARIDQDWQDSHGKARGGTMGRFQQQYLASHFIARAYLNGTLIAFVSFQRCNREWCLDVMRHSAQMPDGTMHALVHCAIEQAQAQAITRLSLAATLACPDPSSAFFRWAARQAVQRAGGSGLRQFKSSFAPVWEPRYAASPSRFGLCLGLMDIAREVHQPPALTRKTGKQMRDADANEIHNSDENNEVALRYAS